LLACPYTTLIRSDAGAVEHPDLDAAVDLGARLLGARLLGRGLVGAGVGRRLLVTRLGGRLLARWLLAGGGPTGARVAVVTAERAHRDERERRRQHEHDEEGEQLPPPRQRRPAHTLRDPVGPAHVELVLGVRVVLPA